SISIIEFTSYAFDLSTFASAGAVPVLTPRQRPTEYLLNPNPDDPYFRQSPGDFAAELTDRVTSPLWGLVFALLPLLFLGQAQSTRVSRGPNVAMASTILIVLRALAFFLTYASSTSRVAMALMYVVPVAMAALTVVLVLRGRQVRPPERVLAFLDSLFSRIRGLVRRRTAVAVGSA